jgi:hypothetical protein
MRNMTLSMAGVWTPVLSQNVGAVVFRTIFDTSDGKPAIAFAGWGWNGVNNTVYRETQLYFLKLFNNNQMTEATSSFVQNPSVNGVGEVIAYDFNKDGNQDLYFGAYNEYPFTSKSSTVLMSNSTGGYDKGSIETPVLVHSGNIGNLHGSVILTTVGYGDNDPYFTYDEKAKIFVPHFWDNTHQSKIYGSSIVVADLDLDGKSELIASDFKSGPGYVFSSTEPYKIAIYNLNGSRLSDQPAKIITPYFDAHADEYNNLRGIGPGLDHMYNLTIEDFNHDGRPDIMASTWIWTLDAPNPPSMLQLLQNGGNLNFVDVSDAFMTAWDKNAAPPDYSKTILDIDKSGINSFLLAAETYKESNSSSGNYLLVNDGTGHFYSALHDRFDNTVPAVFSFIRQTIPTAEITSKYPAFIGYLNQNGNLDYVAEVGINDGGLKKKVFVNVGLDYNLKIDFKENIEILDRNNSKLIRTFAGNDSIRENNSNGSTSIDGGYGLDRSVYSGSKSSYSISIAADRAHVKSVKVDDTLINVERLEFADTLIAVDIQGNAGQAYRLYKAALDRTPDANGLAGWIKYMDDGASLTSMAQQFIDSHEFKAKYGALDNTGFVNQLYINVLARKGEAAGVEGWVNGLANGLTRAQVLAGFSESSENQANVIGQIKDGIAYNEWWLA